MTDRPITTAIVARRFGVTPARVKQLDPVLKPRRTETNVRIYDPEIVDAVEAERRTAADQRARQRLGKLLAGRTTPARSASLLAQTENVP